MIVAKSLEPVWAAPITYCQKYWRMYSGTPVAENQASMFDPGNCWVISSSLVNFFPRWAPGRWPSNHFRVLSAHSCSVFGMAPLPKPLMAPPVSISERWWDWVLPSQSFCMLAS